MLTRREWLTGLFLARAAAAAVKVKAGSLETLVVHVNARGNWVLARLGSSAGLTGIGEASQSGDDRLTLRYLRQYADLLKGRSVFDLEWLRQKVKPDIAQGGRSAACALSALEQCSWDIIGQALNVPAYDLFGGALRNSIRVYANINRSTNPRTPAGFAAMAENAIKAGFDAVKLAPWDEMPADLSDGAQVEQITQKGIDCAVAARKALGPARDLLLDAHSKFDVEHGLKLLPRVVPLRLFWLEEVTPPPGLPAIRRAEPMPTAGGEVLYGARAFYPYMTAGSVDILMPDVKYCGGMLEVKKVGVLAEAAGLQVAPHGPASPVGTAAAAQVCATLPNFLILEFSFGEVPWRAELIDPPEDAAHGRLTVTQRPGLGIRLNEKTAAKYRVA
ncbi:MAG TPA: mandelate racemase/muconate lactonizing enzyme family protein [Bryobacteraceae bacterium]|nr:mandelate racemase/muconate lactonizing enzyme family protein [Bryobacteraceae bacterium]